MTDEPDSIVLGYLRRMEEWTERVESDIKDMKNG